jgi:predicted DNA-binding transcriptional regulator AlpA
MQHQDSLPLMLDADRVAAELSIGLRTLDRWIAGEKFPPPDLRVGRVRRWRRETLARWIEQNANSTEAATVGGLEDAR